MSYEKLKGHIGHKLTVFNYGLGVEFTVECEDCSCVLYTEGRPNVEIVADVPDEDGNLNAEIHFNEQLQKLKKLSKDSLQSAIDICIDRL